MWTHNTVANKFAFCKWSTKVGARFGQGKDPLSACDNVRARFPQLFAHLPAADCSFGVLRDRRAPSNNSAVDPLSAWFFHQVIAYGQSVIKTSPSDCRSAFAQFMHNA